MRLALALVAAALVAVAALAGRDDARERFLDRYVAEDGRVVRHDQGGDTVSEGQSYALLIAVAAGDEDRFAAVWEWTRSHLLRPDGLLAWRWADGRVAGAEPAADADLDAARALLLAADRFDEPRYRAAGRALGRSVVEHETVDGVVVAGPWARAEAVVNPSYWSPRALEALGLRTPRAHVDRLTAHDLPPDWARIEPWAVFPTGPPGGGEPAYSYDAVRLPIRFAESCHAADRRLAARAWPRLRDHPGAARRALDGEPVTAGEHPAALAGAAAGAHAAGRPEEAARLLDRAEALDADHPTYYGAAWVALARTMLQTDDLGAC